MADRAGFLIIYNQFYSERCRQIVHFCPYGMGLIQIVYPVEGLVQGAQEGLTSLNVNKEPHVRIQIHCD